MPYLRAAEVRASAAGDGVSRRRVIMRMARSAGGKRGKCARRLRALGVAVAAVVGGAWGRNALAQTQLFWDVNGATADSTTGTAATGTWDLSTTNWSTRTRPAAWRRRHGCLRRRRRCSRRGAMRQGLFTVTLSSAQTAAGLILEEGNVTLAGTMTLTGSSPEVSVAAAASATLTTLSGAGGLTKSGGGF